MLLQVGGKLVVGRRFVVRCCDGLQTTTIGSPNFGPPAGGILAISEIGLLCKLAGFLCKLAIQSGR